MPQGNGPSGTPLTAGETLCCVPEQQQEEEQPAAAGSSSSAAAEEEQYQYFDAHVPSNAVAGDTILVTAPNGNRPFCFTLPPAAEEDELARHASTGRVVRVRVPKQ